MEVKLHGSFPFPACNNRMRHGSLGGVEGARQNQWVVGKRLFVIRYADKPE